MWFELSLPEKNSETTSLLQVQGLRLDYFQKFRINANKQKFVIF